MAELDVKQVNYTAQFECEAEIRPEGEPEGLTQETRALCLVESRYGKVTFTVMEKPMGPESKPRNSLRLILEPKASALAAKFLKIAGDAASSCPLLD